jgi:hypothetical protein
MNAEVVWAAGYAVFLLGAAVGLDRLARHAHQRADRYRTAGFRYHPHHDAWVCPQNEWLWPTEFDPDRRMVRYRAKPSVCNACPAKADCTTSPHGREIVRALDPWPHSEAGRFHRGLALMLISLAALILVIEVTRHHTLTALAVLTVALALTGALGWRFLNHLRHTPAGFPDPTPSTGLRLTTNHHTPPPPEKGASASRSRWGSDAIPARPPPTTAGIPTSRNRAGSPPPPPRGSHTQPGRR